ncbi:hypothetical protein C4B63_54g15 [Trypanosoma cruzi]|uniref:3-hydroxyacyl-CoA dehydrogenase n=1 Tax=Trypanosoma cruzi TaxID=5693 RepID=A0A2V2V4J0_TRYCR|nr:hypothetical protein C4B63_54g15 [Trypanosoma cruzi]
MSPIYNFRGHGRRHLRHQGLHLLHQNHQGPHLLLQNHQGLHLLLQNHQGLHLLHRNHQGPHLLHRNHQGPHLLLQNHQGLHLLLQNHQGPHLLHQNHQGLHLLHQNHQGPHLLHQNHQGLHLLHRNHQGPHLLHRNHQGLHLLHRNHQGPHLLHRNHQGPHLLHQNHQGPHLLHQNHQGLHLLRRNHQGLHLLLQNHQGPHLLHQNHQGLHLLHQNHQGPHLLHQNHQGLHLLHRNHQGLHLLHRNHQGLHLLLQNHQGPHLLHRNHQGLHLLHQNHQGLHLLHQNHQGLHLLHQNHQGLHLLHQNHQGPHLLHRNHQGLHLLHQNHQGCTCCPEPPRAAPSSFVSARKNVRLGTEDNKIRGHRKRGGEREDRHPGKRGESFQFKGKPTGSGAREGSKRLSLNDIIDDVGEIKVVFAQRGTDKRSHSASPPLPPIAPSPPLPPSPTPSLPQQTLPSFSAPIPSTGGTGDSLFSAPVGTSQEGEDDIFFTIAPRTSEEGFQGKKWPKSVGFSVDEEIETARATRPLVPSPDVAQETKAKLRLNVVNDDEQSMADMEFDKNKLNPLPHKEAAEIGRHEIPDVVSERAEFTQPMPTKDSSKNNEKTEHSTTTASLKPMEESSSFPLSETVTPSPRNAGTKMPVERPPLAPWMPSVRPEDGEDASCAKVSFKNDGSPVTTILLETQPTNIMSLVKFLHRTITLIENQHITAGKKTEVLFTTFPTLGFFNAKHGPLELTSGERVELLRAKESLFARMENASKQIHFVANVHGGAIEDFGAELFLACHHRVLLDPAQATFGFPSINVGDFPAASTVRRLSCLFGSQRTIEMAPRFHEYNVESIMDVGLLEGHSSPPAPSFLLRLECAMLEFLSRATQKELLLRKLFFTSGFDTSAVLVSPNPLLKAWGRYAMAAIVQGKCATNNDGKAVRTQEMRSESIFSEMLYTTPAINAANVCSLGCEMKRRALPSLPSRRFVTFRGKEVQQWDEKMKALSSAKDDCAAVLLDCSQRFINATAQIVASHQDILVNVNVVLIGEEHVARPIISTLPCSVVVSCASPYRVSALGRLQEVRVFAQDSCSSEASETALNAALTYLQTQDSPYVVSRGSSSKRLIAALATEACRLTQQCDVSCIERVATDVLGLFVGPFHLIDYFGPAMVIRMLEETNKMNTKGNPLLVDWLPSIAHHALNGMINDGYLGVDSRRGGFFSYREDGTAIAPNAEVLRRYFSRPLSDTEVADRLLAVVVNECCEMILSGCVRSATDANVMTIAAIGFRETTGGALALADKTGISALVQKMEELSNWHGPHLRPSSLLKCMAHSKVSFASLSDAMIQSARM